MKFFGNFIVDINRDIYMLLYFNSQVCQETHLPPGDFS